MNALIGFATWYGATSDSADIIADVLREKGAEVRVANLEKELVEDISEFDLVVVGAGVRMGRWNGNADKFIDRHKKELRDKKVAIFASAAGASISAEKGETDKTQDAYEKHLTKKAEKYSLNPVSMKMFGGVFDYNKMGWLTRRLFGRFKKDLREAGFEEEDGVFDTRSIEEIRKWAEKLVEDVVE